MNAFTKRGQKFTGKVSMMNVAFCCLLMSKIGLDANPESGIIVNNFDVSRLKRCSITVEKLSLLKYLFLF